MKKQLFSVLCTPNVTLTLGNAAFAQQTETTYSANFPTVSSAPAPSTSFAVTLGGVWGFSFTSNATTTVTLCVQRGFEPIQGKCMFNITVTADKKVTLPKSSVILEGTYYVTALSNDTVPASFDAQFLVNSCQASQIQQANKNCVDAPLLGTLRPALTAGAASVSYASYRFSPVADPAVAGFSVVGVGITSFSVKGSFGIGAIAQDLVLNSTFLGANYSTAASSYFFPLPSNIPGTWYFELTIVSNTTGTPNITIDSPVACTPDHVGCTNTINPLVDTASSNLLAFTPGNGKLGYAVYAGSDAGWRIGVSTAQGPTFNTQLSTYIAYGYVPFVGANGNVIADYTLGCTLPAAQCTQVATIELPKPSATANTPYYIAVDYRNGTNTARTLVWVSTSKYACPTCNHGACPAFTTIDYATYGKCKCNYGYAGTDCSISAANFRIQIIVVIIIGVLLLVTAIIGLIAWFISKRRAAQTTGYERV